MFFSSARGSFDLVLSVCKAVRAVMMSYCGMMSFLSSNWNIWIGSYQYIGYSDDSLANLYSVGLSKCSTFLCISNIFSSVRF